MEIKISLEGADKLVTSISRVFGGRGEAEAIVSNAEAKAKALGIEAQAEQDKALKEVETAFLVDAKKHEMRKKYPFLDDLAPVDPERFERTAVRLVWQETRRQQNMEAITGQAALALPDNSQINDQPVEEDWINNFFENCKDIGDAQMQALWGKILAGEVAQPGSYSRRTLAVLKMMNATDVKVFEEFYIYVWAINNRAGQVINYPPGGGDLLAARGCVPAKRMHLADIGLIRMGTMRSLTSGVSWTMQYEEDVFSVKNEKGGIVNCHGEILTRVGVELMALAKAEPDYQYRDDVLAMFAKEDLTVTHIKGPNPPA